MLTDRWIGKPLCCWVCGEQVQDTVTTLIYAADVRSQESQHRKFVALFTYVHLCFACFRRTQVEDGLMKWERPKFRHTIADVLETYPLECRCEACDGRGDEGCTCWRGTVTAHGFMPPGYGGTTNTYGSDLELMRIGPTPGPIYPASRRPLPLKAAKDPMEQAIATAVQEPKADTSGPWDGVYGGGGRRGRIARSKPPAVGRRSK